jgi:hypothetical protein
LLGTGDNSANAASYVREPGNDSKDSIEKVEEDRKTISKVFSQAKIQIIISTIPFSK